MRKDDDMKVYVYMIYAQYTVHSMDRFSMVLNHLKETVESESVLKKKR